MYRKSLLSFMMLVAFSITPVMAQTGSMTDNQVIEYVKTATEAGKSQKQIMMELAAKGVTREQAERIKKQYEAQQSMGTELSAEQLNRQRRQDNSNQLVEGEMDLLEAEMNNPTEQTTTEAAQLVFGRNIFVSVWQPCRIQFKCVGKGIRL